MKTKLIKCLLIIFLIALTIISLYPSYKFYMIFHENGFSNKNQDWANAGSFFGGVYSAIFSFASVIILSITLILTKKYNNQQLQILLTAQRRETFCSLFDKLTNKMNEINYYDMGLQNEDSFFYYCEQLLLNDLQSIKRNKEDDNDPGDVIDLSTNLVQGEWFQTIRPYYDVVLITGEILNILDQSPEDDKRFFLAYMEANASTRRLYWLFCFMYSFDEKYSDILIRNTRTLRIPKGYV